MNINTVRTHTKVTDEKIQRGLLTVPEFSPILQHVVGRTVLMVGDDMEMYSNLQDHGFKVFTYNEEVTPEPADTVIVLRGMDQNDIKRFGDLAHYAVVNSHDSKLDVFTKYQEDDLPFTPRLAIGARTINRTLFTDHWMYALNLADTDVVLRASAPTNVDYPNGSVVRVRASGIVATDETVALIDGEIDGAAEEISTLSDVLTESYQLNAIHEGRSVTLEEVLGSDVESDVAIRQDLIGRAGTIESLQSRFQVRSDIHLTANDVGHSAIGVVLEPETPYGRQGFWFDSETIRAIVDEGVDAITAVNHQEGLVNFDIIRSWINDDPTVAKPGSWLIECSLDDKMYEQIRAGTFRGFSIKGTATLA